MSSSKNIYKAASAMWSAILHKYDLLLKSNREFSTEEFRAEINVALSCNNLKQSDQAIIELWHLTKHPVLLYFFDDLEPKRIEFQFFIAKAYGLKTFYEPKIAKARKYFWMDYHTEQTQIAEAPVSDESFQKRTVNGKLIAPAMKKY